MRTMAAVLVLAAGSRACLAQDLFGVTVTDTGGGNVPTLSVRGSSLPDLLEELVDTSGQFSAFNGTSLSASVLYAGVTDAMTVTVNNTGSVATLQFTVLGSGSQVFTFDEANGNLEEQVTDFLLKEAPSVLKDFFREINRRSLVSVTDGNPMASTARATRYTFDRFVMRQRGEGAASPGMPQPTEGEGPSSGLVIIPGEDGDDAKGEGRLILRLDASAGVISTDLGDGETMSISTSLEFAFNRRVSLVVAIPVSFHNIEGSFVGNVGFHADVPLTILHPDEASGFYWVVTPGVLSHAAGSYDMASGGLLYGFGGSTQVGWSGDGWRVSGGAAFTALDSATVRYGDYEYNAGVDQNVVKLGAKVARELGENWFVYGGATYTELLEDAAIEDWITPSLGVGFSSDNRRVDFTVGWEGDFGDGYDVHQGVLGVRWRI